MLGTHKLTSCLPRAGALHQKSWHPSVLALRPESFFDGLGTRLGPLEAENGETPPALSLDSFKRRGRSGLWAGTTLGAHPLQNRSPGPSWDPSRQALRPARTSRGPSAGPRTPRSWRSPPWISTSSCPPSLDRDIWRSKRQKDRCRFCSNRGHEGARCRRTPSSDTGEQGEHVHLPDGSLAAWHHSILPAAAAAQRAPSRRCLYALRLYGMPLRGRALSCHVTRLTNICMWP